MTDTPGMTARRIVQNADTDFRRGKINSAGKKLGEAFGLKREVESYSGTAWQQNHHDFTAAMLDMAVLWYKLGNFKQGDSMAAHAQAWADDPNCSSQKNFERSFSVRKERLHHFSAGLFGWLRAALPI